MICRAIPRVYQWILVVRESEPIGYSDVLIYAERRLEFAKYRFFTVLQQVLQLQRGSTNAYVTRGFPTTST